MPLKSGRSTRFALLVATRGNPKSAAAVIEAALMLSSGQHEIVPVICCDSDDPATYNYFRREYTQFKCSIGPRPKGLGAVWNRGANAVDADFYIASVDDAFLSSPYWDAMAAQWMCEQRKEIAVLAANDLANKGQCTLPFVSREWIELTGRLFDDRFPFWFFDTCLAETYSFVTGRHVPAIEQIVLSARKSKTSRMQDLPFWWRFYLVTRQERMKQAEIIRRKLNIDINPATIAKILSDWHERDESMRRDLSKIEAHFAIPETQNTAEYIAAKADAERYMQEDVAA